MEYSQITNRLYYGLNGDNDNSIYTHIQDPKVILVLDYLYKNATKTNIVNTNLKQIIENCGYKLSYKERETNWQFKKILNKLKELNIIEFKKIDKPSQLIEINIINLFEKDKDNKPIKFFKFDYSVVDKIKYATSNNKQFVSILKYYYNFSCRYGEKRDTVIKGGNSGATWSSYKSLSKRLSFSESEIKNYNNILIDLDLLIVKNLGKKRSEDGIVTECSNIYVPKRSDYETAIKEGVKQYKNHIESYGFEILKDAKSTNNRKLYGELGGLLRLKNSGQATQKHLDRIDEIRNLQKSLKDNESKQYKYKKAYSKIFKENENNNVKMLLSDYYLKNEYKNRAKKFRDIEKNLGLIDKNNTLDVNYEFYKEIILNYNKENHDTFVHKVKKYKEMQK